MDEARIEVKGIKELQKSLRDIDKTLPKELAAGLAEAAQIVLSAAQPKVPYLTGAAQGSMKVRKSQRSASIAVGGTKAPYFPWLDFGGRVGPTKETRRPFLHEGRFIYPTLREKRGEVNAKIDEVMKRLAAQNGFDTTGKAQEQNG